MDNQRGYCCIGLHGVKNAINVGGVLRAAGCYGVAAVFTTGDRYKRVPTDVQNSFKKIPVMKVDDLRNVIPFGCKVIAVELVESATPLMEFKHPERAMYVFGPEDGTLGKKVLSWVHDTVYIPTHFCMNLAATVNVVMYDRLLKLSKGQIGGYKKIVALAGE